MEASVDFDPRMVSVKTSIGRGFRVAEAFALSGEAIGIPRNDNELYLVTGGTALTTLAVVTYVVAAWWSLGVLRALRDDRNPDDSQAKHHEAAR